DRVERSGFEGRTREVGPEQITAVSGSLQHFLREVDPDRGRELSRAEAGADADVQDPSPAKFRSHPVQPLPPVDPRVDPGVPRGGGWRHSDLGGNEYLDYCRSFRPQILGHGHPLVVNALRDVLDATGTTMLGTPHGREADYAERLLRIFKPEELVHYTDAG